MKIISADITGSLIINNQDVTTTVESSSIWSGSIASRVTDLEQFSSSLDATFATDQELNQATASLSSSIASLSGSYLETSASFVVVSGSYSDASGSLSVRVTNNESTISVLTTASASFALVSQSYSSASGSLSTRLTTIEGKYTTTGSNNFTGSQNITGSFNVSTTGTTPEFQVTASGVNIGNATSDFHRVTGSFSVLGPVTGSSILTPGTITAQTLVVQTVTSSVVYSSGSNVFGCSLTNTQQFTGSMFITGSVLRLTSGSVCVTGNACFSGIVCSNTLGTVGNASIGGTITGTTIYGSTAICGAVICGGATTLTGALTGTSATFSEDVRIYRSAGVTTGYINFGSTGTNYFGWVGSGFVFNGGISTYGTNAFMSGNVGIGNSAPCAVLHIQGTAALQDLLYFCTGGSVNTKFVYSIASGADDAFILRRNHITQGNLCIMAWTYNGYVGIGCTTPNTFLEVAGAKPSITATDNGVLNVVDTSALAIGNGGSIAFRGKYNSAGNYVAGAAIVSSKTFSNDGNYSYDLLFYTRANGSSLAEGMRIDNSGNVSIGTSSAIGKLTICATTNVITGYSTSGNPTGLRIEYSNASPNSLGNEFLWFQDCTNSKFVVYSNGTAQNRTGTYGTLSDINIKQDVIDASSQWNDIKNIRVRKFRLKDEVAADPNYPYHIGVIAQELETVSPGLVDTVPNYKSVDGKLVKEGELKMVKSSLLYMKAVKALQEAMDRIEVLESCLGMR